MLLFICTFVLLSGGGWPSEEKMTPSDTTMINLEESISERTRRGIERLCAYGQQSDL